MHNGTLFNTSSYNNVKDNSVSEFNEFKPRLKSPKNRFERAGLNLEKLNTILSKTNHIWAAA